MLYPIMFLLKRTLTFKFFLISVPSNDFVSGVKSRRYPIKNEFSMLSEAEWKNSRNLSNAIGKKNGAMNR